MTDEIRAASTESSWDRPKAPPDGDGGAPADPPPNGTRTLAGEVSAAVKGGISKGAEWVEAAVRTGIGGLGQALDEPERPLSPEAAKAVALPEISLDDPLASIGARLDREADLWRGVATRQLARAAFLDRVAVTSTLVVLLGEIVLAAIAGFRAMFASDQAVAVAALLAAGASLPIMGVVIIARTAARIRDSHLSVRKDALLRADLAEVRLHRLAALIETRRSDREGYAAALRAFERDVRSA